MDQVSTHTGNILLDLSFLLIYFTYPLLNLKQTNSNLELAWSSTW